MRELNASWSRRLCSIILAWACIGHNTSVLAANIRVVGDIIYLSGDIAAGDSDRLIALAKPAVGPDTDFTLDINSPGGDAKAALDLAIVVSLNRIPVRVSFGSVCYSSCFSIFAVAPRRLIEFPTRIGVHQLRKLDGFTDPLVTARLAELYRKLGIEKSILEKMSNTTSNDIALLSDEEIKSLGPSRDQSFDRQDIALKLILVNLQAHPTAPLPSKEALASRELALVGRMPTLQSGLFWDWYDAQVAAAQDATNP